MYMQLTSDALGRWVDSYKIRSYEVDCNSCVTIPCLCQYLQESAWNHAEHLGVGFSHLMDRGAIWALSRQKLRMHCLPRWGDIITIHTWPSGVDRLFCYRDFRITGHEGTVIGIASTAWFIILLKNRRPQRTDEYIHFEYDNKNTFFDTFPAKLHYPDVPGHEKTITVRFSDLDINEHVNNVKYVSYLLDTLPFDYIKTNIFREMEINYLSEAHHNNSIKVSFTNNDHLTFMHRLTRNSDNTELCRAKTIWSNTGR